MAQRTASRRRDARQVFGHLLRIERERCGLTQSKVVERLDALAYASASTATTTRRRAAASWGGKDFTWVSRIESGDVKKLDRAMVVALCRALDCDRLTRDALLLAAGLSPYPIPACDSWEEMREWYHCAAACLPAASRVTSVTMPRPADESALVTITPACQVDVSMPGSGDGEIRMSASSAGSAGQDDEKAVVADAGQRMDPLGYLRPARKRVMDRRAQACSATHRHLGST